jgi:hypothetical protein
MTFAALQLGLAVAIECWLLELRDPYAGHKMARLCRRARTGPAATVVVLGSSRADCGLRAQPLEKRLTEEVGRPVVVFNFGLPGGGPVGELLTLKRLLSKGVRPDLLLVEVLPPLLSSQNPRPWEALWMDYSHLGVFDLVLLENYGFPSDRLHSQWWETLPVPWYAYRFNILSTVAPTWLPWAVRQDWCREVDAWGRSRNESVVDTPEKALRARLRARKEYQPYLRGFRLGGPACQALRDLLTLGRRENIRTVLLMMPEGPLFRSWYPPEAWPQIQAYLDELTREFGTPVINARAWLAEELFKDSHHLRPEGAEVFTRRIGGEVWKYLRGTVRGFRVARK